MDESFNRSSRENSYFNLKNKTFTNDLKKTILLKALPKNYLSGFVPRTNELSDLQRSRTFHNKADSLSVSKRNFYLGNYEFSRADSKHQDKSQEKTGKKSSFLDEIVQKQKSKDSFKMTLEKSYSLILEILNGKWDELENVNPENNKEIIRGLNVQTERREKLLSIKSEIFDFSNKFSIFNENKELLDTISLVFSEYEKISQIFHKWISHICQNTEMQRKNFEDKKNHQVFGLNKFYSIVVEILNLVMRIDQKKQSDLEIPFENDLLEKEWKNKLSELELMFQTDYPQSHFLTCVANLEIFHNELLKKIGSLKEENQSLQVEMKNLIKSYDSNTTLKGTFAVLSQRMDEQKHQLDEKVISSLDYLKKFEKVYQKNLADLQEKNEQLENETYGMREKLRNSSVDIMSQTKKHLKKKIIQKKDQATQLNSNLQDNQEQTNKNNIFFKAIQFNRTGFKMPKLCVFAVMNLLFSDKIMHDFNRFLENRAYPEFQTFTLQWFLSYLGNQTFANLILNDFFASFTEMKDEYKQCEIFNHLCGLKMASVECSNYFYASTRCARIFLKILDFVSTRIKNIKFLTPFLPLNDVLLLTHEESVKVLEYICDSEENDQLIFFAEILKHFNSAIETKQITLVDKKKRKNSITESPSLIDKNDKNLNIYTGLMFSVDVLAKFIIDMMNASLEKKISEIVNSLKIIQSNRKVIGLFLDDFTKTILRVFPQKTQQFAEECFMEFVYNNSHHDISTLKDLMKNVERKFSDMPYSGRFYLDFDEKNYKEYKEKYFDLVSSIIVLTYLYENIAGKIKIAELKNDNLYVLHEQFKKELSRFPKNIENQNIFSSMGSGERKESMERVEILWKLFRTMADILFCRSDMNNVFGE